MKKFADKASRFFDKVKEDSKEKKAIAANAKGLI